MRNKLYKLIEDKLSTKLIVILLHEEGYTDIDIFDALKNSDHTLSETSDTIVLHGDDVIPIDIWILQTINTIKERVEFDNKVFKDISKHDIISSRGHFMQQNVDLSNELYHLKKYVEQLEYEKRDLQNKLESARNCKNLDRKCYECKDELCVNSIHYKK